MPNTNFQTIHQMGGAINSFVKQATGRDNVQNIDMEHITVAQNHYYEDVDISGRVVSFNAGAAGIPLEKCLVQIEPVQEGTGDPSPDNVRPISGWTKAKVFVSPTTDEADGTTYTSAFPAEAGTVYGGTLDVATGELVLDRAYFNARDVSWNDAGNGRLYTALPLSPTMLTPVLCSHCEYHRRPASGAFTDWIDWGGYPNSNRNLVVMMLGKTEELSTWNTYIQANDVEFVYSLESPQTYHLTPQEVRTILGQNNIWADTGDIEVKFKNIKEFF